MFDKTKEDMLSANNMSVGLDLEGMAGHGVACSRTTSVE